MVVEIPRTGRSRVVVGSEAFVDALTIDVAACERSLCVQFSTFEGDDAGQAFADLLLERAAAGVAVRVILDGYSEVVADDLYPFSPRRTVLQRERGKRRDLLARLEAGGVSLHSVNPVGRFARYLLYRDHKKVVVIDESLAYVGGLNISDHNYGWHDLMVRIEGPVVADLVADFESTWAGRTIVLDEHRGDRDYALNSSAGRPTTLDAALDLIAGAHSRIVLESPYLCGDRIQRALLDAARRGVRVVLVTPRRPNHSYNRVWARRLRRQLRHPNVEILGYEGSDGMTHAKILIIDDALASFGSSNYQEIEAMTHKELNIVTRDPQLVAALAAVTEADIGASRPVATPRTSFGWFTYRLAYLVMRWSTRRLLSRPRFRDVYC